MRWLFLVALVSACQLPASERVDDGAVHRDANGPDAPVGIDARVDASMLDAPMLDAPVFACATPSPYEPDGTIATASIAPIPPLRETQLGPHSLCPAGDVDVWQFRTEPGDDALVQLTYAPQWGPLEMALYALDGQVVDVATGMDGALESRLTAAPAGFYYARITSTNATEQNYVLTIRLTAP